MDQDPPVRVLIADDSTADAELAIYALKRHGLAFTAEVVSTEVDFRRALDAHVHDVIISDNSMPQFSGKLALEIARELAPRTPFIILSGSVQNAAMRSADSSEPASLSKNDLSQLGELVLRCLARRNDPPQSST